jgi:hypothetical protein
LDKKQRNLIKHTCVPSGFDSSTIFIREFIKHYGPKSHQLEDIVQNLEDAFQERMFPLDLIYHLREISFEEHLYKEEDTKEVHDIEKTSPVGEKVYNDEKNKSFPF